MKKIFLLSILIIFATVAKAQCIVFSDNGGYSVEIYVKPIAIVAPSSCQWGYNYNVKIQYDIIISGTRKPDNLYTLQGTLQCGSQTLFYDLPNSGGSGILTTTANPWRGSSDCNTATVNSLGCDVSIIHINGPELSSRTFTCYPSALPIELIHFEANLNPDRTVGLIWETASELNNDYFTVERSIDAENWESIGKVNGAGNSTSSINYSFVDSKPKGKLIYYRLKQTDVDGEYTYSSISAIELPTNNQLLLYPNPAENNITISGEDLTSYTIVDLLGRNVTPKTRVIANSNNELTIDIANLTQGSYLITMNTTTVRFTKI